MRYFIHLLLALVTAIAIGFGLSYVSLERGGLIGVARIGPWVAWPDVGSPDPDPYTRAYISRTGALHLAKAEGLRFAARVDSDGEELDLNCTYRIDGSTPVAAFWTLTVTDEHGTVLTRPGSEMAINSTHLARADDGSAVVRVGPTLAPGNWLEVSGEGPFELILTIYDSSILTGVGSPETGLPAITKERCA